MGTATLRLQKEYKAILKEPVPNIVARPSQNNILDWHYILIGAEGTDYDGGHYHGKVTFPSQYPFKPPAISMCTPSGRFQCNTRLCLSMSDYHPEAWTPMWSVSTILAGLVSFMYDDVQTTGSVSTTSSVKKQLARDSLAYNIGNPTFCKLFPDKVEEIKALLAERERTEERQRAIAAASSAGQNTGTAEGEGGTGGSEGGRAAAAAGPGGAPAPPDAWPGFRFKLSDLGIVAICIAVMAVPLLTSDFSQ